MRISVTGKNILFVYNSKIGTCTWHRFYTLFSYSKYSKENELKKSFGYNSSMALFFFAKKNSINFT